MLNVKKTLTKILDVLSGSAATIKSGSITFPYTAESNGILTIRISTASGGGAASYAYFSISGTTVAGWSGYATGGTQSVCFGVKKGEIITMTRTQIAAFNYRLVPTLLGGVVSRLLNALATAFFRKGVAVC